MCIFIIYSKQSKRKLTILLFFLINSDKNGQTHEVPATSWTLGRTDQELGELPKFQEYMEHQIKTRHIPSIEKSKIANGRKAYWNEKLSVIMFEGDEIE